MVKKYLVQVKYSRLSKPSYFATDIEDLKVGEQVLINTERGEEMGITASKPTSIESITSKIDVSTIIGRPTKTEVHIYNDNLKRAKAALKTAQEESDQLKLGMSFLEAEYVLDASKLTLIYTAEGRVDFRELLKILTQKLHTRIEFHQIGARDIAKATGGIGPCGRELCCLSFLKNFDGISINRAKNQQLALNNAKLSGSCGKLMCCLLFEDDTYTREAKDYPAVGSTFKKDKAIYKVLGFNIVSRTVKCEGPEGIVFIKLSDIKK